MSDIQAEIENPQVLSFELGLNTNPKKATFSKHKIYLDASMVTRDLIENGLKKIKRSSFTFKKVKFAGGLSDGRIYQMLVQQKTAQAIIKRNNTTWEN